MTSIVEIKTYSPAYHAAIQHFLNQLTPEPMTFTESMFKELLASTNSYLFFLMQEEKIAGMLTVGIYHSPTGGKAWIEDVVVDEAFRGQGLSKLLVNHAIEFVQSKGIPLLMLTSNPKRIAANKLYQAMGFERKETNAHVRTAGPGWRPGLCRGTGGGRLCVWSHRRQPADRNSSGGSLSRSNGRRPPFLPPAEGPAVRRVASAGAPTAFIARAVPFTTTSPILPSGYTVPTKSC